MTSCLHNRLPKLFISYSHEDEGYFNDLRKHLKPIERNGTIESWHDRKLLAGDELDEEIRRHLEEADIVVFLISKDFLASFYCYEIELLEILRRREREHVRIIPVVLKQCLWTVTPLKDFLAATKDGKPISHYSDPDTAWVEVVENIREAAKHWRETVSSSLVTHVPISGGPTLRSDFRDWLERSDVLYEHRFKQEVFLTDIFVYPELRSPRYDAKQRLEETCSADRLLELSFVSDGILVYGEEQCGKTSLLKIIYQHYHHAGLLPVYVDCADITNADLERALKKQIAQQYEQLSWDGLLRFDAPKVLLLDNLHNIKLNPRFQQRFLKEAKRTFSGVVLLADSDILLDDERMAGLAAYRQYEILPFGHVKRGELIEKWNSMGQEETIDPSTLHHLNDVATRHLDSVIRRNVVPRKPIYILTILQHLDSVGSSNFSLTSYGYCYQVLIQQALSKVGVSANKFDRYVNYLSELAYYFFKTESLKSITGGQFEVFKEAYSQNFLGSHDEILEKLHGARILRNNEERLWFSYRYILYFYVGKYLADHIDACEKDITALCAELHDDAKANILIFLMHHSRDQRIIDEVILRGLVTLDGVEPATLSKAETRHIVAFINALPELVLKHTDVDKERKRRLRRKDEIDSELGLQEDDDGGLTPQSEVIRDLAKSVRLIDVIGQVLRNRSGSLLRPQLLALARTGFEAGLKFLACWLNMTRTEEKYLLRLIYEVLREEALEDGELEKAARRTYLALTYGICFGLIRRIANSLGSEELFEIFDALEQENPQSIAARLINVAIQFEFQKRIPKRAIESLSADLSGNPIGQRLLQEIAVEHLYLNHVRIEDKQWISAKLGVPMLATRLITGRREK